MTYTRKAHTEVVQSNATKRDAAGNSLRNSNAPLIDAFVVAAPSLSQYIRIADLASTPGKPGLLPVSPAAVWRWAKNSEKTGFPRPLRLGPSVTVWSRAAVEAFIATRSASAAAEPAVNN